MLNIRKRYGVQQGCNAGSTRKVRDGTRSAWLARVYILGISVVYPRNTKYTVLTCHIDNIIPALPSLPFPPVLLFLPSPSLISRLVRKTLVVDPHPIHPRPPSHSHPILSHPIPSLHVRATPLPPPLPYPPTHPKHSSISHPQFIRPHSTTTTLSPTTTITP